MEELYLDMLGNLQFPDSKFRTVTSAYTGDDNLSADNIECLHHIFKYIENRYSILSTSNQNAFNQEWLEMIDGGTVELLWYMPNCIN